MKIQDPVKSIVCETQPQQFKKGDKIINDSLKGVHVYCLREIGYDDFAFCGEIKKCSTSFKMNKVSFDMLPTKLFKKDLPVVKFFLFRPETFNIVFDEIISDTTSNGKIRATFTISANINSFAFFKFQDFAKRKKLAQKTIDGNYLDTNIAKATIIELVLDLLKKRLRKSFILSTKEWRYTKEQREMKKEIEEYLKGHFETLGFGLEVKVGSLM